MLKLKVDWEEAQKTLEEVILFSKVESINKWIMGYMKLLGSIGDLFEIVSVADLQVKIIPSQDLIQLCKGARRRYEQME